MLYISFTPVCSALLDCSVITLSLVKYMLDMLTLDMLLLDTLIINMLIPDTYLYHLTTDVSSLDTRLATT